MAKVDYKKRDITMAGKPITKVCQACFDKADVARMITSFIDQGTCSHCGHQRLLAVISEVQRSA